MNNRMLFLKHVSLILIENNEGPYFAYAIYDETIEIGKVIDSIDEFLENEFHELATNSNYSVKRNLQYSCVELLLQEIVLEVI